MMGSDPELLRRLARDLDDSFEALVLAYQDRLYAFAVRMLGDRRDAEEVTQDAFVRAYRALGGYEPARIRAIELRPWLYTIVLNALRNRARGKKPVLVPLSEHDEAAVPGSDPAEAAETSEEAALLAKHVAALPMRHRAAVLLRFFADLSYEEIATALGEPVGTVKSNVHRGVARLRAAMVEGGS